jgi:hypothetical protein
MGMFDKYENFEDHFKPGDEFTLEAAKLGAMLNTVHGPNQQVLFTIDGQVYSAFGTGFVGQVQRLERGDLPAKVVYTTSPAKQQGRSDTKILEPVG